MAYPTLERRSHARSNREVYTAFALKDQKREGLLFTRTLGVGGFSFVSENPMPRGVGLELSLYLPNLLTPLQAEGKVVHSTPVQKGRGFHIGVSFQKLGEIGRSEIRQFIEG